MSGFGPCPTRGSTGKVEAERSPELASQRLGVRTCQGESHRPGAERLQALPPSEARGSFTWDVNTGSAVARRCSG